MREEEGGMLVAELSEAPAGTSKTIELPRGAKMELVWCPPGRFKTEIPGSAGLFGAQHKTVSVPEGFWIAKTEVTQKQWRCVMGNNPSNFQGDDNPVEGVEEDACREFCRRAGLDLPTVEQWEYACRAGSSRAFGGTGRLESMGWYKKNSGDKTHPVGEKTANDWGLFDMHGNVWELCEDGRQRGGSWHSPEDSCRSATVAGYVHQNRDDLGFRPVRNRP